MTLTIEASYSDIMKSLIFAIFLCLASIAPPSFASQAKSSPKPDENEKFISSRIWAGLPAGALYGFGLGHGFQGRYLQEYGWAYTIADTVGVLMLLSHPHCPDPESSCRSDADQKRNTGAAILVVSRVIQITDLSIWSYSYYRKFHPTVHIIPTQNGASVMASISF